ncbi:Catechol oxidase B, chloroplastic [Sesamum alatum]|uniref:Catechol oxidase B, chloroplastic n=1 Tax=Sesamum alatum TaxID=300844 RepID=A0AAE1XZ14_9LAMI|nr:Catechol oxidase B, chloroplastic [Sesamum alatum]
MASLPLPLTSATPSSQTRPVFARPSYFITHAKRSNHLRVSCTDARNKKEASPNVETPLGKVDRRNMLLGLGGGLYSAANLISTPGALADPVQPPQLDTCGNSTYTTSQGQDIKVPCCPPTSPNPVIDYQLSPVTQMKVRPAAQYLTPEYIYKYNKAIECMKKLEEDDPSDPRGFMQQANIHCAYCNGAYTYPQPGQDPFTLQVHNSWLFFPFHRCTDPLQLVTNNLTVMYNEMIGANSDIYGFMESLIVKEATKRTQRLDPLSVVHTPRSIGLLETRERRPMRT